MPCSSLLSLLSLSPLTNLLWSAFRGKMLIANMDDELVGDALKSLNATWADNTDEASMYYI